MKKIRYDRCYNDIGVVLATKLRHYLFYLQPYFSALGGFFFLKKSCSLIEIYESVIETFWDEVFMVRNG